jgi:hypothetical protein
MLFLMTCKILCGVFITALLVRLLFTEIAYARSGLDSALCDTFPAIFSSQTFAVGHTGSRDVLFTIYVRQQLSELASRCLRRPCISAVSGKRFRYIFTDLTTIPCSYETCHSAQNKCGIILLYITLGLAISL